MISPKEDEVANPKMKLSDRIKQARFASPQQESMLSVIVTGSWIIGEMASAMTPHGLTPAQYNALRILRGAHPELLTCGEIGSRLLDRTPDVTRMVTRLMKMGLVDRARADRDRRIVEVWITQKGLDLLKNVDPGVDETQDRLMGGLSADEHTQLITLLEKMRTG